MATVLGVVSIVAGAALALVAMRDAFHTLFHPSGVGSLSDTISRGVWALVRRASRRRPKRLARAGPIALVTVLSAWAAALVLGSALIALPFITTGFYHQHAQPSTALGRGVDAFYVSCLTLLGGEPGDLTAKSDWLRVLLPLERAVGFGLLTVAVSWVLAVYPVRARSMRLAHDARVLERTLEKDGGRSLEAFGAAAGTMLDAFTRQVVTLTNDLKQFPITYYFRPDDPNEDLPAALDVLDRLVAESRGDERLRAHLSALEGALADVSRHLGSEFLGCDGEDRSATWAAFARDQLLPRGGGRDDGPDQPVVFQPPTSSTSASASFGPHVPGS